MGTIDLYCVYIGYSNENHIYVGITKDFGKRVREHLSGRGSKNISNLINQGFEFYFELIHKDVPLSDALIIESLLIKRYKSLHGCGCINTADIGIANTGLTGQNHKGSKLTDESVVSIRNEWANDTNLRLQELADRYEVSKTTISNVVRGKRSPHLPGPITLEFKHRLHQTNRERYNN